MFAQEIKNHLTQDIIPFWKTLADKEHGGYYGYMGYDLQVDKKAIKGCILNSRITWFFANAYIELRDESLLEEARHGYEYMIESCLDKEYGGMYWATTYDGELEDSTKHTYNQAFAIYALTSYYKATDDKKALDIAFDLFWIIETKCRDEIGYKEAFDREFHEIENDKLSENGVIAAKTMNTLLHILEAYTELYRVTKDEKVRERLTWILNTFADKVYNPTLHRLEVFFDQEMKPIIDLHSYGHDIEASWLIDRGLEVLEDVKLNKKLGVITDALAENIYKKAFDGKSLANECEKGVVNTHRIWWVQAETIIGFLNAYEKHQDQTKFKAAYEAVWSFIKEYVMDHRNGSEWFWEVGVDGTPLEGRPIVEPWKCPYHNGRMCLEVLQRK